MMYLLNNGMSKQQESRSVTKCTPLSYRTSLASL